MNPLPYIIGVVVIVCITIGYLADCMSYREANRTERWKMYYNRGGQEPPVTDEPPTQGT